MIVMTSQCINVESALCSDTMDTVDDEPSTSGCSHIDQNQQPEEHERVSER